WVNSTSHVFAAGDHTSGFGVRSSAQSRRSARSAAPDAFWIMRTVTQRLSTGGAGYVFAMSESSSYFSFDEATTSSMQSWFAHATTTETTIAAAAVTASARGLRLGDGRQTGRGRTGRFTTEVYGRRSTRFAMSQSSGPGA